MFNFENEEQPTRLYLKCDVVSLAVISEKFIKVSIEEFDINSLYSVSLPGYTWWRVLKITKIRLKTLQDKDMILLLKHTIRGGISSVMGVRYVKSDENKKIM